MSQITFMAVHNCINKSYIVCSMLSQDFKVKCDLPFSNLGNCLGLSMTRLPRSSFTRGLLVRPAIDLAFYIYQDVYKIFFM